jgi:transcriptional regulator with GAF, ATPase, and Fis domain
MSQAEELGRTFVELADTLVTDFDVVELMHTLALRYVELVDVDAAGIMLADHVGRLQVIGSSSHRSDVIELLDAQQTDGPCQESFRTRTAVTADLGSDRWPVLGEAAASLGFHSVVALPMRLRTDAIGAVSLFRSSTAELSQDEMAICRALADVATIGLLQERAIRETRLLADQLQTALTTRVVLEQAKGVLAQRANVGMDVAFDRLRSYARSHNRLIGDVAREVVAGQVPPELL